MSSLHADITTRLASISDTPNLDASVLLAHILNRPRTWIMAHPELTLTTEQQHRLDEALTRIENGEAFPYVLGHWEFFGLDLEVTPDVLIPRPETELLVEKAIVWLQESSMRSKVADVGTGSGAIAVSLAVNVPHFNVLATDISPKALQVAQRNAEKNAVSHRINFVECNLLPPRSSGTFQESKIDLLCANLPYISTKTLNKLPIYGREPTLALDGGENGLEVISNLLRIAPLWLAPDGLMLLEIEATHGLQAINLAQGMFPQAKIHLHQDLTGRDRLIEVQL